LASTREQFESADILPRPELNPLLNPILTDNMGRWAEVYFTSPPERREEAVIELLHELEKEKEAAETHPASDTTVRNPARHAHFEPQIVEQRSEPRFCWACKSDNPVTHQFCGMCGAKLYLDSSAPESAPAGERDLGAPRILFAAQEPAPQGVTSEESYEPAAYDENRAPRPAAAFHAPAAGSDELSLFQSLRSPETEEWDYEPPPSTSYRFYIAAVLLIVIGVLGYMAWRGAQTSQSSHEASAPPPAPITESAQPGALAQPAASAPQPAAPAQQTSAPKSEPEAAAPPPAAVNTVSSPKNSVAEREGADKTPSPAPAGQAASQQVSSSGGVEELALAERYLNGSGGRERNSSEAATWLWKAMAKHNGHATMLLADLYLRGDGVSKNCEQGRVLLDSAARRGIPGASNRLRNLPAFGCH